MLDLQCLLRVQVETLLNNNQALHQLLTAVMLEGGIGLTNLPNIEEAIVMMIFSLNASF